MNNRVLNLIVLVENTLSIYRNYDSFSVMKKIIVSVRMALDIILILTITSIHLPSIEYNKAHSYRVIYFCLNITFSLIVILLAAYKSTKFIDLTNYFEKTDKYFIGDEIHVRNILKKHKIIKTIAIVYGIFAWIIRIYVVKNTVFSKNMATRLFILVVYFVCEIRYVVEYIILYGILGVLSELVKSITRNIGKETNTLIRQQNQEIRIEITQDIAKFSKWTQIYCNLKDCSNLINNVFGVQISILLIMAIIYSILLSYSSIANYFVFPHEHFVYIIYREIVFLIALLLLARGAQEIQKSVEELRRCLADLLIRSTGDQKIYKVTRDFLRFVTNQPLKTQAFGSLIIDMSLLPKFITLFASYTVIALQFNNVM